MREVRIRMEGEGMFWTTFTIVALVETKIKLSKLHRLTSCVPKNWLSCNNFHLSAKGTIWISWNPKVWTCNVYATSIQQITLSVKNHGGLEGYLTVVYDLNTRSERQSMWWELKYLQAHNSPWLITGDFNNSKIHWWKGWRETTYFPPINRFQWLHSQLFSIRLEECGELLELE